MSGTYGVLTNCIITGNFATNSQGGGVYVSGYGCTIAGCRIVGNRASLWGGGIRMAQSAIVLKDSFIGWNNVIAQDGAAIASGTLCSIFNCTIVSNGNLGCISIIYGLGSRAVISNCVITGNMNGTPFSPRDNPAYYSNKVINCQIINNHSTGTLVPAGGLLSYGTLYRNCLIANNRATGAASCGGLRVVGNSTTGTVESCTIVSNRGVTAGGVYNDNGATSRGFFYNTIISSNAGNTYTDMYAPGDTTNLFFNCCCPTITLPPAQGNIQSDPLFVSFDSGDYHLTGNSPCANTGTNQYSWMTGGIDLDGQPRIRSGTVDMGCFEYIFRGTTITVR